MPSEKMQPLTPIRIAREIAPLLHGVRWGIGGSVLLHRYGLIKRPRDLDIVTTPEEFPTMYSLLTHKMGRSIPAPHAVFSSRNFARFQVAKGMFLDTMAGIQVRQGDSLVAWNFDPTTIVEYDGLPWMTIADWRVLYSLFGRPERVHLIECYLARKKV